MKSKGILFFAYFFLLNFLFSFNRIITLAPALSEIVCTLGAKEKLVGISSYAEYPKNSDGIVKVGTIFTVNYELMLSLKPDLILTYHEDNKTEKFFKNFSTIKVFKFKHKTLKEILDSIIIIGKILNKKEIALKLVRSIKKRLEQIKRKVKKRKKVMVIIMRERGVFKNIYILGNGDFIGQVLEFAGGDNVYRGKIQYPKVSEEFFLTANPDLIIELIPDLKKRGFTKRDILKEWKIFMGGRFYNKVKIITEKYMVIPGPRITKIAEEFYKILNYE